MGLSVHDVVLHLGSNLGNRSDNLDKAIEMLSDNFVVKAQSGRYQSSAWGLTNQDDFYNQALLISTDLSAHQVLVVLEEITTHFPSKTDEQWGPRHIDIDILFYDNEIISSTDLKIPHPRLHLRNFVLIPLMDIIPNQVHPDIGLTISELQEQCSDDGSVILIEKGE